MIFLFRCVVALPCVMIIAGCVPSKYDIKKSYVQASSSLKEKIYSVEERISEKFNKIQSVQKSEINNYQSSNAESIEELLADKPEDNQKETYDLNMPLQSTLVSVITNHPEVKVAHYLEEAAEQDVLASKGLYKPQITGSLNAGGIKENTNSSSTTTGLGLNAGISQLIYDGGYTAGGIGKKNALFEKAKSNKSLVQNRIGFEATSAWIDLWASKEKLNEINITLNEIGPILADIKRMAGTGLIDRTIVDNIENSLLKVSMNKENLEIEIEKNKLRYENFFGKVPNDVIKPENLFDIAKLEEKISEKSTIPSLRFAAAEYIASQEEVNSIQGEFKPKVNFKLTANSPLDRDDNASLAIGIASTYTFSDGGVLKARLKVAQAKSSQMKFALESARFETTKSIKSDIKTLSFLKKSRTLILKSLQNNKQSLSVLKSQIKTGQSKLNNLIDMHVERLGIRNNLLDNTAQIEITKYSLASILGLFSGT